MSRFLITTLLLAWSYTGLFSQELPDIERLLEDNEITAAQEGYEEIVHTLLYLSNHPLPVNEVGFDSLKLLCFLSDSQIDNLLRFRERVGKFSHPNELLLVMGVGQKDIDNILPFIRFDNAPSPGKPRASLPPLSHELIARVRATRPKQAGYTRYSPEAFLKEEDYQRHLENRFRGAPWGTLIRYKATAGKQIQVGVTLENDPGEKYFSTYQKSGFDFLSAHVSLTPSRFVEQVIVGDYKLQWGQGVVAWHGFSSGKSSATLSSEKSGKGATPYTSTDENNFLRGAAVTLRPFRNLTVLGFISSKKTDGNRMERDSLDPEDMETASLDQTGYHRSLAEGRRKHALKELTTGLSSNYNHRQFRVGYNLLYYHFTPSLRIGDQPYQQYNDPGNHRLLTSIDYKTGFYHFYLFGETALSDNGSLATVNGLRYSGYSRASLAVIYRRYDKQYTSHYNSSFGEFSNSSNEEGIYIGLESTPVRNLKLNAYYDWFRYFSPRYRATTPKAGYEILGELLYKLKKSEWTLRFKQETKPEDLRVDDVLHTLPRTRQEYRAQFSCKAIKQWELRTRFDYIHYRKSSVSESGTLLYQDFIYTLRKPDIKTQFRVAWFNTDSYNTRVYAYEHNVLYGYSFPAYYDKGIRSYLNLNWKPTKKTTLYLKGGVIHYPNRTYISSSLTRVEGNTLWDISCQVRVKM